MSKSSTTTEFKPSRNPADWLHNSHAGEMLWLEFMEPLDLTAKELAHRLNVEAERIVDVVSGAKPMDADLDLRLSRYFGMSEGFFLRLQVSYELLEAKRAMADAFDRIVPRAA